MPHQRSSPIRFATALLALTVLGLHPASAEDGPLLKRLKERREQREQNRAQERTADPATTPDTSSRITQPGDYRYSIQFGGETRLYRLHVPTSYRPGTPVPLLFALHGGGGSMDYQADDSSYGQITSSEKNGHIVVVPNGISRFDSGKLATWNAGKCCGQARDKQVDDVGFIRQIVANLTRQLDIDPKRIYATGMSNGGMMAYRLACEMPDVFAAIAPVAGTDNTVACTPTRPVSVLHIHARNDERVLYEGGAGFGKRSQDAVTDFKSVPASLNEWLTHNSCAPTPQRVLDVAGAYCDRYNACKNGSEVQLCITETGGHSWPGGKKARAKEGPSQALSANDVMWEFFKRH
ncbi:MAG: prolyl oligopeptidase family serine peptidase [Rhodocyclaceae bacterium]|nr:prolyl oligopeptidase family serine peptidase [Rhodocyclaceae bacterium]